MDEDKENNKKNKAQQEPVLLIMAAGMGSRYGGLKQLDPVTDAGEIILDFSLYDAFMAGFKRAVLVIKKETEELFRKHFDGGAASLMDISYAFQDVQDVPDGFIVPEGRVKAWGTGHAVLTARELIHAPFAVINADDYYGPHAFHLLYDFLTRANDDARYAYAMVGYKIENTITEHGTVSRGICTLAEDGTLQDITERTEIMRGEAGRIVYLYPQETAIEEGSVVSMNFWGFTESMMQELADGFPVFLSEQTKETVESAEYFLPAVVDKLIKEDKARVQVFTSPDRWYGVTYKEDKECVVNAFRAMKDKGIYPEVLWKGYAQ